MKKKTPSPCETCTRVSDPGQCTNNKCKVWVAWWLARWERIHAFWLRYGK
jgi:hypothetical protein